MPLVNRHHSTEAFPRLWGEYAYVCFNFLNSISDVSFSQTLCISMKAQIQHCIYSEKSKWFDTILLNVQQHLSTFTRRQKYLAGDLKMNVKYAYVLTMIMSYLSTMLFNISIQFLQSLHMFVFWHFDTLHSHMQLWQVPITHM